MAITYKIDYDTFDKYFFKYTDSDIIFSCNINKMFDNARKAPFIIFLIILSITVIFVSIIFRFITWLVSSFVFFIIKKIFNLNIISSMNLSTQDIWISSILVLGIFILILVFKIIFTVEMPYIFRDLINDRINLEINITTIQKPQLQKPQPFENSRFIMLGILKNKEDIRLLHSYIPGFTDIKSMYDARKKLRSTLINKNNILDAKFEYIPWCFEIVDYDNKLKKEKKEKIEYSMEQIWNTMLDKEYNKINYIRKSSKSVAKDEKRIKSDLKPNLI